MIGSDMLLQTAPSLHQLDATCIGPRLYQGSAPNSGSALRNARFTLVVLCAKEYQPSSERFPGVHVLHVPFDDSLTPSIGELRAAAAAADTVAREIRNGGRVLVTCMAGRNRSGLVTAMALVALNGWTGDQAARHIQALRPNALTNTAFVAFLNTVGSSERKF
jgi:protein-tyrosine phosphatase